MLSTGYGADYSSHPVKAFVPSEYAGQPNANKAAKEFAGDEQDRLMEVKKKWDKVDAELGVWIDVNPFVEPTIEEVPDFNLLEETEKYHKLYVAERDRLWALYGYAENDLPQGAEGGLRFYVVEVES